MIVVVGVGADGMTGLAQESLNELLRAAVIYGSKRQLDLHDDTVRASGAPVALADAACAAHTASTEPRATSMWWPAEIRCCMGWAVR
jgi:precorrin-6B methylase 1